MSLFDFMSDGVEEAIAGVNQQLQLMEQLAANVQQAVAPLENGGWIGEGAQAFFDETQQFLAQFQQARETMEHFNQALNQTLDITQQAVQKIRGVITR